MASDGIFDKYIALVYIGRKLNQEAAKKDLTQDKIAENCGVAQTTINRVLNGRVPIKMDKLEHIAVEGIGVSRPFFKNLVIDAKAHEFKETTGKDINDTDLENILEEELGSEDADFVLNMIEQLKAKKK